MTGSRMDAIEINEFLETQDSGVLALADDDVAYSVPVSYAFDPDDSAVHFRLGYGDQSQKRAFVDATASASFVVAAETDQGWKSVVAQGPIEEQSESAFEAQAVEAIKGLEIPYFTVHDQPANELEFTIASIDVKTLTGVIEDPAAR